MISKKTIVYMDGDVEWPLWRGSAEVKDDESGSWGYHDSWMVYVREHPWMVNGQWMI